MFGPVGEPKLFVVLAENLARCRIHKMGLLAGNAGDRSVALKIVRNIFGYKALDSIAGIRATVEKGCHGSLECWV